MYDLGELKLVKSVDMAFYNGNIRRSFFVIQLSSDGIAFTDALTDTSSGTTTALENYDFTDLKARYVKIIGNGNSQSLWNSITETRINWNNISSGVNTIPANHLTLSPNPFYGDILTVELENRGSQSCKVQISDMNGKLLYTKNILPTANKILLNDIRLTAGVYTITVATNNIQQAGKLLVR
jgi:endoglucanase